MTPCERTQALVLEHLYDVLEADERRDFEAHLADCANCQAALARAKNQQRLLARAAKEKFDGVRFTRPAEEHSTPLIPFREPAGRGWKAYALAASLLLVVLTGLGVPASFYWAGWQELQPAIAQAQSARDSAQKGLDGAGGVATKQLHASAMVKSELYSLEEQQRLASEKLTQDLLSKERFVTVTGPETLEAGAPNDYTVVVKNLQEQPVDTNLGARFRTKGGKELAADTALFFKREGQGTYKLSLPRDFDVPKTGDEVYLELFAKDEARKGEDKKDESKREKPAADEVAASFRTALRVSRPLYITHVATDKPMYQPGESVWFRSLTLERYSLKPAEELLHLHFTIKDASGTEIFALAGGTQLVSADNKPVEGPDKKPLKGIGAGSWPIPPGTAGGEYTLTVADLYNRFPPEKRKFLVNEYEKSPFRKKLEFERKSYGPGDDVKAGCLVEPAAGGRPIARQPVQATVRIDGKMYGIDGKESNSPLQLQTDDAGAVTVRFRLPTQMERGEASLAVKFTDGASTDTIVRTIPVILKKFYVQLFPEGGDLVAGVPNRVYFQARTTLDKPAELTGRVVDSQAHIVARLETLNDAKEPGANQGMGVFEFTPEAGKKYLLQIDNPVGVVAEYEFPAVKTESVVLHIAKPVLNPTESIPVRVYDTKGGRNLLVGVYCRGRLLAHQTIATKANVPAELKLEPGAGIGGVYRVTVFEEMQTQAGRQFTPRAERLIYRAPCEKIDLTLRAHRQRFMPGEKVMLNVEARSEIGKLAPAVVMLGVVDKTVLSMADEKTARAMPTQLYLASEVRKPEDLEFADFMLLGDKHPKAALALDLLLGTQGWRRFAEQDPAKFQEQYKDDAVRLMASIGQTPFFASNQGVVAQTAWPRIQQEATKAAGKFAAEIVATRQKVRDAEQEWNKAQSAIASAVNKQQFELRKADTALTAALGRLEAFNAEWRNLGLLVFGIGLLVVSVAAVFIGLLRKGRAAMPYFATATCSVIVLALGIMWLQFQDWRTPKRLEADNIVFAGGGGMNRDMSAIEDEGEQFARRQGGRGGAPDVLHNRAFGVPKNGPNWAAPAKGDERPAEEKLERAVNGDHKLPAPAAPAKDAPGDPRTLLRLQAEEKEGRGAAERRAGGKELGGKVLEELREADHFRKADKAKAAPGDERMKREADRKLRLPAGMPGPAGKPPAATAAKPALRPPVDMRFLPAVPGEGKGGLKDRVQEEAPIPGAGGGGRGSGGGYPGAPGGGPLGRGGFAYETKIAPPPPLVVREYSHRRSGVPGAIRRDFAETLAWYPALVLTDGTARIEFELCDSLTTFEALVYGHTTDGRLGVGRVTIESRLPFSVQPKIPIEVTASDKIDVPVSVSNDTEDRREVGVEVQAQGLRVEGKSADKFALDANQKARRVFRLTPELVEGQAQIKIDGRTEPFFSDSVLRNIRVVPDGFPVNGSKSDVLEKIARNDVVLPETWIKGTLQLQVQVYPSTLADLQKGLEGLLREPNGCFEQTSTSNYPNILILDYLRESDLARPEVAKRAQELLDRGYQKLTSFECRKQGGQGREGYEWFGGAAPPHEALTAYGLLQFRDMARVHQIDASMVDRTRTYLMSRRDGQGGFTRNPRALDSFGRAPADVTNAYIVWALTESSKDDDVTKELDALKSQAQSSQDPYFLALVANSFLNRGQNDVGMSLLTRLAQAQKAEGHLDGARTSITGSSGRHLQIETTALTLLGWLKANRPEFVKNVQLAVRWLGQQRSGSGAFGSTQSTILALKALIEHTKANKRPAEAGDLILHVAGKEVARLPFKPTGPEVPPLVLAAKDAEACLKAGKNDVRIEITGNNVFPYTLSWSYQTLKPASAEGCPVQLETKLDRSEANENDTVRLTVSVKNVSGKGHGMTVAIVGLPAGLTLPEDLKQLQDYTRLEENGTKPGRISAWEIRGRELVLYWRDLAPDAKIAVPLDLVCRVPGEYRGPASRAYLYYNSDAKHWVEPLGVKIKAGAE